MTDRTHPTDKESPMTPKTRHDELKALLSKISEESVTTSNVLDDMLDLLRDRLPEPEGVKEDPDALPAEFAEVEPEKTHPCPGCGTFTDKRVCNSCWGTSDDPEAGYSQAECIEDVPAPADDGLAEWERELFRPAICCGKCPPIVGGGYDCTCEGNPKCRCGSVRFGYPDHICTKPPRHEGPHGYAGVFWSEPGPADDLPGEPVEPGDLRAGDKVAFTWWGVEHSTCTLVSVAGGSILRADANDAGDRGIPYVVIRGEWAGGISDVRLLERAPREDEGPDEALAPDYAIEDVLDEVEATLNRQKVGVRAEVVGDSLRLSTLTGAVFLAAHDPSEGLIASQRLLRRATKAETERDEWKARHEALREDVETRWAFVDDNFLKDILHSILKGDDERAKGEQR